VVGRVLFSIDGLFFAREWLFEMQAVSRALWLLGSGALGYALPDPNESSTK
jgi:hypothetical protein